jgi:magnesium-transporting ATPase (P-type)
VLDLRVDESMLTGESLPSDKRTDKLLEENLTPGDMKNIAFMGTAVVYGRGRGLVVETGRRTVIGDIAEKVQEVPFGKALSAGQLVVYHCLFSGLGFTEGKNLARCLLPRWLLPYPQFPKDCRLQSPLPWQ